MWSAYCGPVTTNELAGTAQASHADNKWHITRAQERLHQHYWVLSACAVGWQSLSGDAPSVLHAISATVRFPDNCHSLQEGTAKPVMWETVDQTEQMTQPSKTRMYTTDGSCCTTEQISTLLNINRCSLLRPGVYGNTTTCNPFVVKNEVFTTELHT